MASLAGCFGRNYSGIAFASGIANGIIVQLVKMETYTLRSAGSFWTLSLLIDRSELLWALSTKQCEHFQSGDHKQPCGHSGIISNDHVWCLRNLVNVSNGACLSAELMPFPLSPFLDNGCKRYNDDDILQPVKVNRPAKRSLVDGLFYLCSVHFVWKRGKLWLGFDTAPARKHIFPVDTCFLLCRFSSRNEVDIKLKGLHSESEDRGD